jgi:exosortase B
MPHQTINSIDSATVDSTKNVLTPWIISLAGVISMYSLTFWDLFHGLWAGDQQGHGPIVLAISIWLLWQNRLELLSLLIKPKFIAGWTALLFGLLIYLVGRSQNILIFEVGSIVLIVTGLLLLLSGYSAVKLMWFPIFFMVFMVPLPGVFVDALTQPMKVAVSYVAEFVLYHFGYPISRSGVILQIGQYQLLVADACAGLNTLFTLEALGLLYLNLVRHQSATRNILLAIFIVPISFTANVIRVMVLTLITYHFGDAAGQGFLHGFAGMVLFLAALALIIALDSLLRMLSPNKPPDQPIAVRTAP